MDEKLLIKLRKSFSKLMTKDGISFPDGLFTNDDLILSRTLDINQVEINCFKKKIISESTFDFNSAKTLLAFEEKKLFFSTGSETLDKVFQGGIPRCGIVEIVGESSTGKTQLCLQLSITSQLANNSQYPGVVYISTECRFPTGRLHEIIDRLCARTGRRYSNDDNIATTSQSEMINQIQFADHIFLKQIDTTDNLLKCLRDQVKPLVKSGRAHLVIVDSIAALFRADYHSRTTTSTSSGVTSTASSSSSSSITSTNARLSLHSRVKVTPCVNVAVRTSDMYNVCRELNELASVDGVAVVCVNQVKDSLQPSDGVHNSKYRIHPCLGLIWSNLISTRIYLSKTQESVTINDQQYSVKQLEVIFSSYIANNSCKYIIDRDGIKAF